MDSRINEYALVSFVDEADVATGLADLLWVGSDLDSANIKFDEEKKISVECYLVKVIKETDIIEAMEEDEQS